MMNLRGDMEMRDIRGKEIVGYEAACELKDMGFNWECTGYYHCDNYGCEEEKFYMDDMRYECVGWRSLYRNSYSIYRAAAPTIISARIWLILHYLKNLTWIR